MFETNTPHFKESVSWVSFAAAKWTLHLVPFGLGKVFPFTIIRNRAKGLQCTSVYPWGSVTLSHQLAAVCMLRMRFLKGHSVSSRVMWCSCPRQ